MIRVTRTKKPDVLTAKEMSWKKKIREASTDAARKAAQGKYQHVEVKKALVDMFHEKCAYCESAITHIDYGHIEHFRPKAGVRQARILRKTCRCRPGRDGPKRFR